MSKVKTAASWKPGQSGNPKGRPKGSGLSAELRRAIVRDAENIVAALIDRAKAGDTAAAKVLLDRVLPALKPKAQEVKIAALSTGGLRERAQAVLDAAASGALAPDIAAGLVASVGQLARVAEIDDLEQRVATLEQKRARD